MPKVHLMDKAKDLINYNLVGLLKRDIPNILNGIWFAKSKPLYFKKMKVKI